MSTRDHILEALEEVRKDKENQPVFPNDLAKKWYKEGFQDFGDRMKTKVEHEHFGWF